MADEQVSPPSLDTYLKENTHLFTLMGVFGALAIYLSNIDTTTSGQYIPIANVAAASGFGLVILLSTVVLRNLVGLLYRSDRRTLSLSNFGFFTFALLYLLLLLAIARTVIQYERTVASTAILLTQLGSGLLLLSALYWGSQSNLFEKLGQRLGYSRLTTIFLLLLGYLTFTVMVAGLLTIRYDVQNVMAYRPSIEGFSGMLLPLLLSLFIAVTTRLALFTIVVILGIGVYRRLRSVTTGWL